MQQLQQRSLDSALNKHLAAACLVKAATEHATAATEILSYSASNKYLAAACLVTAAT
jgi:hypothetical protein